MAVRSQMPWPLRLLWFVVILLVGGALTLWATGLNRSISVLNPAVDREQLEFAKTEIEKLRTERDRFSTTVNAAESQLNIERSAQKQLMMQVKTLETENARLKEDLAFFDSLLPADAGGLGVSIRRLKADVVGPNQMRYQLLVMQGGKGDRQFIGTLQLAVTVLQGDKSAMIIFPEGKPGELDKFRLAFRHYQRVEGVVAIPEGATIKTVQARILENGQIRTQMSANL